MMAKSRLANASKKRRARPAMVEQLERRQLLSSSAITSAVAAAAPRYVVESIQTQPSITTVAPASGAAGVSRDASITANLSLPNGRLDPSTVTSSTVTLIRNTDNSVIPAVVNTTGGGDAIILQPSVLLDANTAYTFAVSAGVKDVSGASFIAYGESFTTGTAGGTLDPNLAFTKVPLPTTTGTKFTCVRIGPDKELYASTEDGRIFRYVIAADGTLSLPEVITSLQQANGGNRLITGFAFDPASTASSLRIWVSDTYYALSGATNGPDFTGKLTVMSGPDLGTVQDAVVNLPRSVADHVNDQPVFGPDGALYFCQAGNNAYGAPDTTWGNRPEHLLTGAILRLDVTKVTPGTPLDAKTIDAGGSYNPFAAGAPLTIYADGIRNVYSLLFDSNGTLWAPMNGSSTGGNTPAFSSTDPNQINGPRLDTGAPYSGPNVPALTNVQQTEDDYMYKIVQGGYYGHPNPTRGEYVLDGGNPTAGVDPAEFTAYPVGTQPDANYRGYAYDFGQHRSPDGIIQYHGTAFNGALDGKLLVAEYSAGDDIAVLSTDGNGNIVSADRTVSGLTNFINPVDLTEDPNTGNIYVAELGGQRLTLLRPATPGAQLTPDKSVLAFNTVAAGHSGAAPSRVDTVTITNTGSATLTFSSAPAILNDPTAPAPNAGDFAITNAGSFPASIAPGQSAALQVRFTAATVSLESALLQLQSDDPAHPTTTISLHGVGTAGQFGYDQPSLVQVLRSFNIPTIVGAGPNDVNASNPTYPESPDPTSQEIAMSRMAKAGPGPVTLTPLASFNASAQPSLRFGYYTPGDATNPTELFAISNADDQTMNPSLLGATSFDPGGATFSLYATFPGISTGSSLPDTHYSEDVFNTPLDPAHPRKFRFFPLENPDKSVVPNAYVVGAEDYNATTFNSFVNFVGILRNVKPAADAVSAPVLGLENLDETPSNTHLVFNRNQIPSASTTEVVHDTGTVRLHNSGDQPLIIQSLTLSDPANWALMNPPAAGTSIAPGATLDITIKFIASTDPSHTNNQTNDTATTNGISVQAAGGVWNGTLSIATNDPVNPNRAVQLSGYWQYQSEHENEPGLQTLTNLLYGYGTDISNTFQPNYPNGSTATYYGEEVNSGLWNIADTSQPISIRQLAAYHNQVDTTSGEPTAAAVEWYTQGSNTNHFLFQHQTGESQSVLPTLKGSTTAPAEATFMPTGTFGWYLDGEHSEDALNTVDINTYHREGHAVRFWPARDGNGNIIANTWIMAMDYQNGPFDNSDFQDNVYLVSNMAEAGLPATPADIQSTLDGSGVAVQWAPVPGASGYNIYRSSGGSAFAKLNSSPLGTFSYTDGFAPAGTNVTYHVTAIGSGGVESLAADSS
ncbi:MAG TPA: Ig-like domain-containing protein, partial [Tepidisphaeraceae bacterium]|nr:Ig-like domain-containing protein [Tepidisphaeraceae bacterium]